MRFSSLTLALLFLSVWLVENNSPSTQAANAIARINNVGVLYQIGFLADGSEMLIVDEHSLRFYDTTTWKEKTFEPNPFRPDAKGDFVHVRAFAVSPDGQMLVTCSDSGAARVWDRKTAKQVCEIPYVALEAVFTPDSKSVVLSTHHSIPRPKPGEFPDFSGLRVSKPAVRVFDARTGQETAVLDQTEIRYSPHLQLSADGKHLLTVLGTFQAWEIGTWKLARASRGGWTGAWTIAQSFASADGKHFFAVGSGTSIHTWDAQTGASLGTCDIKAHQSLERAAATPDGKVVFLHARGNDLAVDPLTGKVIADISLEVGGRSLDQMVVSPDGKYLVASVGLSQRQGYIRVWPVDDLLKNAPPKP